MPIFNEKEDVKFQDNHAQIQPEFAVIYRGYLKVDREDDYKNAWKLVTHYFKMQRGALGSCLHRTSDGMWIA